MSERVLEKIRRLRRVRETWQGAIIRFPQWLAEPGQEPVLPFIAMWASLATGQVYCSNPRRPADRSCEMLLEGLADLQGTSGIRPDRVELTDAGLADELRPLLSPLQIEVGLVAESEAIDVVVAAIRREAVPLPDASTGAGVTVERMRAFAEAAAECHRAAPWQHLTDEDLIRIESPESPDPQLSHFVVMGAAGIARGLAFFPSAERLIDFEQASDARTYHRRHGGIWNILFADITRIPLGDAEWWLDHGLPVAGGQAYPMAMKVAPPERFERPDARTLAYFEGVMRALAATTEQDLDRGGWTVPVRTFDGDARYVFSFAPVPEPPRRASEIRRMERALDRLERVNLDADVETAEEAGAFLEQLQSATAPDDPSSPMQQAESLVDRAVEQRGRQRRQMLRQALAIWPDCAEAYLQLATLERDADRKHELLVQAVEAGRRAVGDEVLRQGGDLFRGHPAAPAYLRARLALAKSLRTMKRSADAIEHFREMLRVDPQDTRRARYPFMACLLELNRDDELQVLFQRFDGERAALWAYGRALWAYRREGDAGEARKEMLAALEASHYAATYLLGKKKLPEEAPRTHAPGSEAEGIAIAMELGSAWGSTPDALGWLGEQKRRKRERDDRRRR